MWEGLLRHRDIVGSALALSLLGTVGFAQAATVYFSFANRADANLDVPSTQVAGSYFALVRQLSLSLEADPELAVLARPYFVDSSGLFSSADTVIPRSSSGAGVCSNADAAPSCPAPAYGIDNRGPFDWLLLTFVNTAPNATDKTRVDPVELTSLDLYQIGGYSSDLTFFAGLLGKDEIEQGLDGVAFKAFDHPSKSIDVPAYAKDLTIDLGGLEANFLLIGANPLGGVGNTSQMDAFLVRSMTIDNMVVPAPASFILFASGLVMLAGLRIRRMS